MATQVQITPALPYFAAMFDCDWQAAKAIAEDMGPEHVAVVEQAERDAAAEAKAQS